jgi:Flp pilus assembly protein TadG
MMLSKPNSRGFQRGAAIVETVVVTPLLLFLVLLTAEITNAFVDHNTLTKYARHGVRYLAANAIQGTTGNILLSAPLIDQTRNLVVFGNTAGGGTPILPGLAVGNVQITDIGNDNVQVSATYAYTGLLGGSLPNFGFGPDSSLSMNLQATVAMRGL